MNINYFKLVITLLYFCITFNSIICTEEDEGVKYADKCESKFNIIVLLLFYVIVLMLLSLFVACKILAIELENRLQETGKTSDVLEIGYSVDDVKPKKKKEYRKS